MRIVSTIETDLNGQMMSPIVEVMQNDVNTRIVEARLFDAGTPMVPAGGYSPVLLFGRADGSGGIFDTLPDGTPAFQISENVVTVTLPPSTMALPGAVGCSIAFVNLAGDRLATFPFILRVTPDPSANKSEPAGYVNVRYFLPQPAEAQEGSLLQVKTVKDGKVTEVSAVPASQIGSVKSVNGTQPDETGNVETELQVHLWFDSLESGSVYTLGNEDAYAVAVSIRAAIEHGRNVSALLHYEDTGAEIYTNAVFSIDCDEDDSFVHIEFYVSDRKYVITIPYSEEYGVPAITSLYDNYATKEQLGDIETALDRILEIQEALTV